MQEQQTLEKKLSGKQPVKVVNFLHNRDIDYSKVKAQALKESPMVTSIPLGSFELGRNSTIKIDGKQIPITVQAYNHFLKKVLRVDPNFVDRFKKVTDEKTEVSMLSILKTGMASHKNQMVNILANPKTKEITSFSSGKHTFRTNEALLAIFENVMNSFPNLQLRDFYMMENGDMHISARNKNETFRDLKSETFFGGLTFKNSYTNGSVISHNAYRLVCENGMFGFSDMPLFVGPSEKNLIGFFDKLRMLDGNNWVGEEFWDKMDEAMEVKASVAELNTAKNTFILNSNIKENELRDFLPEYGAAAKWLAAPGRNVNMEMLNAQQQKNCTTNVSMWNLINQVTDFGSHDYGFEADYSRIQRTGGTLLAKPFDVKNLVVFG